MHSGPLSADSVQSLLAKHVRVASERCPPLASKRVSPHVLRQSAAMELLEAGVDCSVIALWLGPAPSQSHARVANRVGPDGCQSPAAVATTCAPLHSQNPPLLVPLQLAQAITGLTQRSKQTSWNISRRRILRSPCIVATLACSLAPFSSCTSRSSLGSFGENQSTPAAGLAAATRPAPGASASSATVAVRGNLVV
jgi:hypothetical protein